MDAKLIEKYNISVPRYTSYPTVPHWQENTPTQAEWLDHMYKSYVDSPGISLYIHLPFCEALCTYCGCNKRITKNHAVEQEYVKSLLKEWAIYKERFGEQPILKELHLGGGTPTFFSPKALHKLLNAIISDCKVANKHEFSFEAHPNSTSKEHLLTLYDLGFRRISIGVQDVSPTILKAINRNQTVEEVANVTEQARSIGYTSVNYDIIYGLPFQKLKHISDTMDFIKENRPDRIAFYSYAHVPWKSKGQRAFTLQDVPLGVDKSTLYRLGRKRLEVQGYKAIGMDHFCLEDEALTQAHQRGEMHRNFMGYTPNYTKCSIGLGASSISDSWTMYVQNEKHIEAYQSEVDKGCLPIIKGHRLTKSEQNTRRIILELMCKDKASWKQDSIDQIAISPYLSNLDTMVADGLVSYDNQSIFITEMGKLFIRNICAAIDPIFQSTCAKRQMFSAAI